MTPMEKGSNIEKSRVVSPLEYPYFLKTKKVLKVSALIYFGKTKGTELQGLVNVIKENFYQQRKAWLGKTKHQNVEASLIKSLCLIVMQLAVLLSISLYETS